VLPFRVLTAIRNYGYRDGMVEGFVAVAVTGGSKGDWAATASYIAQQSVIRDVTFTQVEVYTDSPWGDKPPQRAKSLATAYFIPASGKGPWERPFDILVAKQQGSPAQIE